MTQEDWIMLQPIVDAGSDGKRIESKASGNWQPLVGDRSLLWYCREVAQGRIRIAPEPTFVPWTDDEVPLDAWYRIANHPNDWAKIERRFIESQEKLVYYIPTELNRCADTQELFNLFEHSTDGCKTWKRCGKEVVK